MKKSKTKIVLAIVGVVVLLLAIVSVQSYNGLVSKEEQVSKTWSDVQAQYQRRADLVPNLVATVKGYAQHEQETFQSVVDARAKATQLKVDAEDLTPERMREIQAAQGELSSALGRLMAIAENYPQLKASENFSELQAQLEGTENRINESRQLYNAAVKTYNVSVRRFPSNIFASMFGFEKKSAFEAESGAATAPTVEFGLVDKK